MFISKIHTALATKPDEMFYLQKNTDWHKIEKEKKTKSVI